MAISGPMCGRYFIALPPEAYRAFYGYPERPNFPARYNIAPTQPVPIVTAEHGQRRFRLVRWGFWPGWLKDPADFPLVFNARVETLAEKPTFRGALRHRRCVFLADGFFEWRREGERTGKGTGKGTAKSKAATRTPFMVRRRDGAPMALAGLWEAWMGADGSEVDTAAIVTCGANGTLSAVHERMPAILPPEAIAPWLDTVGVAPREATALCRPCPDDWLSLDTVSERVNSIRNDDADLLTPLGAPQPAPAPRARSSDEDAQGLLF